MNLKEYQKLCRTTAKKYEDKEKELANYGLGVVGEAGDIAGCVKKTLFHKNDQVSGIRENIGDVMWYLAMICNYFEWNLEDVLGENIQKLKARYPKGFTEKDASRKGTRVDWNEKRDTR